MRSLYGNNFLLVDSLANCTSCNLIPKKRINSIIIFRFVYNFTPHIFVLYFARDAFQIQRCGFGIVLSPRITSDCGLGNTIYSKHSQCDFECDSDDCNINYLFTLWIWRFFSVACSFYFKHNLFDFEIVTLNHDWMFDIVSIYRYIRFYMIMYAKAEFRSHSLSRFVFGLIKIVAFFSNVSWNTASCIQFQSHRIIFSTGNLFVDLRCN